MSNTEIALETILGTQFGSDDDELSKGKVDIRRFTRINEAEALGIAYFLEVPDHKGGIYAKRFIENYMNLKVSVDGWRVNTITKLIGASKGVQSTESYNPPGWLGRNITQRNYKEKAKKEGYDINE